MNQVTDGKENVKCSQKTANSKVKSKKAKDPSESNIENAKINPEALSETLANTLHINKINSSLSNGTSDHTKEESPKDSNDLCKVKGEEEISGSVSKKCNELPGSDEATICSQIDKVINNDQVTLENPFDSILAQNSEGNPFTSFLQDSEDGIQIISYESELQMPEIMRLIQKDLSEPYSIYTYRYFIHNWPKLCFLATDDGKCIGAIVCKLDMHRNVVKRGYIAMLAVDEKYRKRKIGSKLVQKAIQAMIKDNADEVVLETEITNKPALKLYENLGFVRDKRLFRYYLNGVDALRLKLWLR